MNENIQHNTLQEKYNQISSELKNYELRFINMFISGF